MVAVLPEEAGVWHARRFSSRPSCFSSRPSCFSSRPRCFSSRPSRSTRNTPRRLQSHRPCAVGCFSVTALCRAATLCRVATLYRVATLCWVAALCWAAALCRVAALCYCVLLRAVCVSWRAAKRRSAPLQRRSAPLRRRSAPFLRRGAPFQQLPVATVAPHLVAIDDTTEMAGERSRHMEDEMHVVRHHLLAQDTHHGIMAGDALHLGVHPATQCRQLHTRGIGTASRGVCSPHQPPQ